MQIQRRAIASVEVILKVSALEVWRDNTTAAPEIWVGILPNIPDLSFVHYHEKEGVMS